MNKITNYFPSKSQKNTSQDNENNTTSLETQEISTESSPKKSQVNLKDRYLASMVLAGVGDAIGFFGGSWEFNYSGEDIVEDLEVKFGSLERLTVNPNDFIVSDDTVMHIATAKALVHGKDFENVMLNMAREYIECFKDMFGRSPGPTTANSVRFLSKSNGKNWRKIPFSPRGGGCGGSMRAMSIGLKYYGEENRDMLVAVGIESGRLTHNHPTGFFGAMTSGAFTAFAIEGKPVESWGKLLLDDLIPRAMKYLKDCDRDWEQIQESKHAFIDKWEKYLKHRGIRNGKNEPKFSSSMNTLKGRDKYYKSLSFSGWGGASGDDSTIIAYDSILGAKDNWKELVYRAVLHGGDSDSTGCIACAWWGALYGFSGVFPSNYHNLEKRSELEELGTKLYELRTDNENDEIVPDSQQQPESQEQLEDTQQV